MSIVELGRVRCLSEAWVDTQFVLTDEDLDGIDGVWLHVDAVCLDDGHRVVVDAPDVIGVAGLFRPRQYAYCTHQAIQKDKR